MKRIAYEGTIYEVYYRPTGCSYWFQWKPRSRELVMLSQKYDLDPYLQYSYLAQIIFVELRM